MRAYLYELRLFADDPRVMLRAQARLIGWTACYLALMLIAFLPVIVPMIALEPIYGHRALAPGESAIVTAQFEDATDLESLEPTLAGRGFTVETPAVRIPGRHRAYWRVRAAGGDIGPPTVSVHVRSVKIAYPRAKWLDWLLQRF